ncbi:MAG: class I mannose-6-phosphate isomerase [Clostridia bacterium]|nr:class I mannose-6-phosphate isomerase [Clostridia bacterium]
MSGENYPVLLKPVFFTHLWGGTLLKEKLNKNYPNDNVGESWEVSAHIRGCSFIASGTHSGMPFDRYYSEVLKKNTPYPLLIKLIGPSEDLSVQVHPDDAYAKEHENSLGKTEAWYIISAPDNASIVSGVTCTKEELAEAVKNESIGKILSYDSCSAGDVVEINPGTVHALLKDTIVYEVQQNSDITYRIYDWDRVDKTTKQPRKLNVSEALDVIKYNNRCLITESGSSEFQTLVDNHYFTLAKICVNDKYNHVENQYGAYTIIEGSAEIIVNDSVLFKINKGDSFYAPFGNNFIIHGKGVMLRSSEK